jgi:hypothetical protein
MTRHNYLQVNTLQILAGAETPQTMTEVPGLQRATTDEMMSEVFR